MGQRARGLSLLSRWLVASSVKPSLKQRWARRPRIGALTPTVLHLSAVLLCAIAIGQDFLPTIAWILFVANAIGAAVITLSEWIGELPEHRKPSETFHGPGDQQAILAQLCIRDELRLLTTRGDFARVAEQEPLGHWTPQQAGR